jgi:hypothetical protein
VSGFVVAMAGAVEDEKHKSPADPEAEDQHQDDCGPAMPVELHAGGHCPHRNQKCSNRAEEQDCSAYDEKLLHYATRRESAVGLTPDGASVST